MAGLGIIVSMAKVSLIYYIRKPNVVYHKYITYTEVSADKTCRCFIKIKDQSSREKRSNICIMLLKNNTFQLGRWAVNIKNIYLCLAFYFWFLP